MAQGILTICFYLLFILTPLIWIPISSELFEFNKMLFVYLLTTLILTTWVIKSMLNGKLTVRRTPLDLPLILFFIANIISTIISIDPHVSLWGYYSRSNGGLLSTISYLILYYALVSNFEAKDGLKFIRAAIAGGVAVSLWAIPEHFGASLSCLLLTGDLNTSCWIQDVQARVFATLGQPNWLAAYLAILIFPSLYFALTAMNKSSLILYSLSSMLLYTAFTFTYSRGATLGLIAGLAVFTTLHLKHKIKQLSEFTSPKVFTYLLLMMTFLTINLIFGSSLTSFKLLDKFSSQPREPLTTAVTNSTGTQLESGGTESGAIRLIVWKGGLEIVRHFPLFGSGVETFAYSYYQFRPVEHNLVSEWDFLYNKAHNEYINYLATTGIIGTLTYLGIITTFVLWSLRKILVLSLHDTPYSTMGIALLASYASYLIQNIFGFSVVITALLFYLIPALSFLQIPTAQHFVLKLSFISRSRPTLKATSLIIVLSTSVFVIFLLARFWVADSLYAYGLKQSDAGNPGKAYNSLIQAINLHPYEPIYRSELAYSAATAAISLDENEATLAAQMKEVAVSEMEQLTASYPSNTSLFRGGVRTYYLLSVLDPSLTERTLQTLDATIKLAPTDPKLTYNKALVLESENRLSQAQEELLKTIELKPNYKEARLSLADIYIKLQEEDKAREQLDYILKLIPNDPEATQRLDKL